MKDDSKKIKLRGRGGSGRGQGNKRIKNKRVKVFSNIPPAILETIQNHGQNSKF